jgi:hypothetical protein
MLSIADFHQYSARSSPSGLTFAVNMREETLKADIYSADYNIQADFRREGEKAVADIKLIVYRTSSGEQINFQLSSFVDLTPKGTFEAVVKKGGESITVRDRV